VCTPFSLQYRFDAPWFRYADPFQDYKQRLARKLQAKGQDGSGGITKGITLDPLPTKQITKKERDDVNWFGVKLGQKEDLATKPANGVASGGVGKYLSSDVPKPTLAKRPAALEIGVVDDAKKKRKLGFGNFESW
jgi:peptidyl-prolyl cis-trans isomerase-like protein 2